MPVSSLQRLALYQIAKECKIPPEVEIPQEMTAQFLADKLLAVVESLSCAESRQQRQLPQEAQLAGNDYTPKVEPEFQAFLQEQITQVADHSPRQLLPLLHTACFNGNLFFIEACALLGLDLSSLFVRSDFEVTPMDVAKGAAALALMRHGVAISDRKLVSIIKTALVGVVEEKLAIDILQARLEQKTSPLSADALQNLLSNAVDARAYGLIERLLKLGAQVDTDFYWGQVSDPKSVEQLVKLGFDVNQKAPNANDHLWEKGDTPLRCFMSRHLCKPEMVEALLNNGATVTDDDLRFAERRLKSAADSLYVGKITRAGRECEFDRTLVEKSQKNVDLLEAALNKSRLLEPQATQQFGSQPASSAVRTPPTMQPAAPHPGFVTAYQGMPQSAGPVWPHNSRVAPQQQAFLRGSAMLGRPTYWPRGPGG